MADDDLAVVAVYLTKPGLAHRLLAVHSVLAALLAVSLLSTSASTALQHVHAYVDHDHAAHHHGSASHEHLPALHADADSHAPDDVPRLKGCHPSEHAVPVKFSSVAPPRDHAPVAITLDASIVTPPEHILPRATPADVRVHSPPRFTDAPLRAPPLVHLA